jgi:hypothetical protein
MTYRHGAYVPTGSAAIQLDAALKAARRAREDRPRKPLGPMTVHEFEQDPEKMGSACRFCGLDERNPVHKAGAGPL